MLAFNGVMLLNGLVSFAMSQLLGANPAAVDLRARRLSSSYCIYS
jgi:hypothetical protein